MATYSLVLAPRARHEFRKLPPALKLEIQNLLNKLIVDPRPPGCAKLKGHVDYYRVRKGDYRIVYQINDEAITIIVIRIGHRRDVYQGLS